MKRDVKSSLHTSDYNRCGVSATMTTIISPHFSHGNILEIQLVQQRSRHRSGPNPPTPPPMRGDLMIKELQYICPCSTNT